MVAFFLVGKLAQQNTVNMPVKHATFVMSNTDYTKCPKPDKPEYAFIGRSNVGKSSLINALTGRKSLAKISGKPGKTRLINHFLIDQSWYLVDLPGYGYAQTGKDSREEFDKIIHSYIKNRENLLGVFVLVDSRHEPQKNDLAFMTWLAENALPFVLVFTKADKLKKPDESSFKIRKYQEILLETWEEVPKFFITSSEKRIGLDEIQSFIEEVNETFEKKF